MKVFNSKHVLILLILYYSSHNQTNIKITLTMYLPFYNGIFRFFVSFMNKLQRQLRERSLRLAFGHVDSEFIICFFASLLILLIFFKNSHSITDYLILRRSTIFHVMHKTLTVMYVSAKKTQMCSNTLYCWGL